MVNIDFLKYKRVFAFGCSSTTWQTMTWADLIANECINADYYNFAKPGAGNLFITNRIVQANMKYQFDKDDLVLVMYSAVYREDRILSGNWYLPGGIFTQGSTKDSCYDKNFVKNYCDPIYMIVRDLALLEMSQRYLSSIESTSMEFITINPWTAVDELNSENPIISKVNDLYRSAINFTSFIPAGMEYWFPGTELLSGENKLVNDNHATVADHYAFLKRVGIPLTDRSRIFVETVLDKISKSRTIEELVSSNFIKVIDDRELI